MNTFVILIDPVPYLTQSVPSSLSLVVQPQLFSRLLNHRNIYFTESPSPNPQHASPDEDPIGPIIIGLCLLVIMCAFFLFIIDLRDRCRHERMLEERRRERRRRRARISQTLKGHRTLSSDGCGAPLTMLSPVREHQPEFIDEMSLASISTMTSLGCLPHVKSLEVTELQESHRVSQGTDLATLVDLNKMKGDCITEIASVMNSVEEEEEPDASDMIRVSTSSLSYLSESVHSSKSKGDLSNHSPHEQSDHKNTLDPINCIGSSSTLSASDTTETKLKVSPSFIESLEALLQQRQAKIESNLLSDSTKGLDSVSDLSNNTHQSSIDSVKLGQSCKGPVTSLDSTQSIGSSSYSSSTIRMPSPDSVKSVESLHGIHCGTPELPLHIAKDGEDNTLLHSLERSPDTPVLDKKMENELTQLEQIYRHTSSQEHVSPIKEENDL